MLTNAALELKPQPQSGLWHRSIFRASLIVLLAIISGCTVLGCDHRERYLSLRASMLAGHEIRDDGNGFTAPAQVAVATTASPNSPE